MDLLDEQSGSGFTPQEVEFQAEQTLVHIVPRFRMDRKLKLIEV